MPAQPSSGALKLSFDNGEKEYKLYSFAENSPILSVRPTTRIGNATAENAPQYHLLYGTGKLGSMQVMPAIVDSYTHRGKSEEVEPPLGVAIKWGRGNPNLQTLAHEFHLYDGDLKPLQGTVVPRCFGFYVGHIEDQEIGCLVLEWCGGETPKNTFELNRQRMLAAIGLHFVGITHNGLLDRRHFITGDDGTLRIIDFSIAKKHTCLGAVPKVSNDDSSGILPIGCAELNALELKYGIASGFTSIHDKNGDQETRRASSCATQ